VDHAGPSLPPKPLNLPISLVDDELLQDLLKKLLIAIPPILDAMVVILKKLSNGSSNKVDKKPKHATHTLLKMEPAFKINANLTQILKSQALDQSLDPKLSFTKSLDKLLCPFVLMLNHGKTTMVEF